MCLVLSVSLHSVVSVHHLKGTTGDRADSLIVYMDCIDINQMLMRPARSYITLVWLIKTFLGGLADFA